MPLLNKKPYTLSPAPSGLKDDEQVYIIDATKEIVRTYEEYVQKFTLYRTRQWNCIFTGKGMTYEEALEEEAKALKSLAKFPKELEATVCRAVHHSTKRIEELVTTIYKSLRPASDTTAGGSNLTDDSPTGAKENESQQTSTAAPPAAAAAASKGSKAPKVTKPMLRTFIVKHANQEGPEYATKFAWIVESSLVSRYNLPKDIPDDVAQELAASVKVPKKRPVPEEAPAAAADTAAPAAGKKKKVKPSPAAAAATNEAAAGPSSAVAAPVEKKKTDDAAPAVPAVPKIQVQAKPLEEVEALFAEGTLKHCLVTVLKSVQPQGQGLTAKEIMDKAKELKLREFDETTNSKVKQALGKIQQSLSGDPAFCRLDKGLYSLHTFHTHVTVYAAPSRKRPATAATADGATNGEEGAKKKMQKVKSEGTMGKKDGASGSAAGEGSTEVRAERALRNARAAQTRNRTALARATATYDEAKALYDTICKEHTELVNSRRESDVYVSAEYLATFEVPEAEREFQGDDDDRKGMLEFRQALQARVRKLEEEKKEFLETLRVQQETAAKESTVRLKEQEVQMKKAEAVVEIAQAAVEAGEKVVAEAEIRVAAEHKLSGKDKERAEKEQRRKYPVEDLQLLEEARAQATAESGTPEQVAALDVHQPSWLDTEEASRLATSLYISDVLNQFGRQLGIKSLTFVDFTKMVQTAADCAGKGMRNSNVDNSPAALHSIYSNILLVILSDLRTEKSATALEKRWLSLLSDATWPEILRRFVITRASSEQVFAHPDEHTALAGSMMSFDGADELTYDQHLTLLRFLVDELVNSGRLRALLQKREDDATDAKRDIREDMAEERRRLRELDEADKEERRKKREEEALAKELAAAAECMAFNDAAGGQQDGISRQASVVEPTAAAAAGVTDEPSFELPEELREYRGDPSNTKAEAAFRQKQANERRKLTKLKSRWMGDNLRAQREAAREAESKAKQAAEAEIAKQLEREAAQEALARAQEILDEKMEKLALRRAPLGVDRHHRRYWWGLGGHRPAVYVEDSEGKWGVHSTLESLEALMSSLDRRGVRELALAQALEKKAEMMEVALRKVKAVAAATAAASIAEEKPVEKKPAEKERPAPMRQSSREHKQAEFFNPCQDVNKKRRREDENSDFAEGLLQLGLGISELTSLVEVVDTLLAVKSAAVEANLEGPWDQWKAEVIAAGQGRVLLSAEDGSNGREQEEEEQEDVSAAQLRSLLQTRAIQMEALINAASEEPGDGNSDDDENDGNTADVENEEEEGEETGTPGGSGSRDANGVHRSDSLQFEVLETLDDAFSPSKIPKAVKTLWNTAEERSMWQADVGQAGTAARLAYCTAVLHQQSMPMLRTLRRAIQGPTPAPPQKKQARKEEGVKDAKKATKKVVKKKKEEDEKTKERPEGARRCSRDGA